MKMLLLIADKNYTDNIRIYNDNDTKPSMNWIEIGQYDLSSNSPLLNILNSKYLDSTVTSINVDPELHNLHVWIDYE